jgi:hypothetical protein
MINIFFHEFNTLYDGNNIIVFDNIDFNTIYMQNKNMYTLLCNHIININKKNIFIFTSNNIGSIHPDFYNNFNINKHYHMEIHINHIMRMINKYITDVNKLKEYKNNLLQINHKVTPGCIIPYLILNQDFQKSLDRFFKIIK